MTEHWYERIGKAIREAFERLVLDPFPERWAALIKRLDAEEDARGSKR